LTVTPPNSSAISGNIFKPFCFYLASVVVPTGDNHGELARLREVFGALRDLKPEHIYDLTTSDKAELVKAAGSRETVEE
jgi:hypothetical protein